MEALLAKFKSEPAVVVGALISIALLAYQLVKGSVTPDVAIPLIGGVVTRFFVTPAQAKDVQAMVDKIQGQVEALKLAASPVLGDNPTFEMLANYYDKIDVYVQALEAEVPHAGDETYPDGAPEVHLPEFQV